MNMEKEQYRKYAEAHAPRSPIMKDCTKAFLFGGTLCLLGQLLRFVYLSYLGCSEQEAEPLSDEKISV